MEKREGIIPAKYFIDYWKTEGMKVCLVKYDHDFDTQNRDMYKLKNCLTSGL